MEQSPQAKKLLKSQVRIRAATESDVNFIFNSWLKCYRHSQFAKQLQNEVFFDAHHKLIEGLLKRCEVLIACNDADISQIYSYGIAEKVDGQLVVHFVYTKESYRKLGVGLTVLEALGYEAGKPYFYTHKTHQAERLEQKHTMIYHPYLAFKQVE